MVFHHFRSFGRQIFLMYETYPLIMNTMAGGVVYIAGEITSQLQLKNINDLTQENWNQIMEIGLLGAGENGLAMLTWYKLLNNLVGSGVSTRIVLIKCIMDQIFFATQQDFLFLALCAYNQFKDLPIAIAEIQDSFWTTWIMDCSLWPFVNFFGFAFVPYKLQPTYMACISYFWQLYISGIASKSSSNNREELVNIFNEIDLDQNHVLDFFEIKLAFDTRGVKVSNEEINEMIADAKVNSTLNGSSPTTPHVKGNVTFEEFEIMVSTKCKAKSAENWRTILEKVPLTKGAKSALKKYNDLNIKRNLNSVHNTPIIPITTDTCMKANKKMKNNHNHTSPNSILEYEFEEYNKSTSLHSSLQISTNSSQPHSQHKINFSKTSSLSPQDLNQKRLWFQTHSPMFHSSMDESPSIVLTTLKEFTSSSSLSDREQAIRNVKWSLSGLTAIALFRMIILKI